MHRGKRFHVLFILTSIDWLILIDWLIGKFYIVPVRYKRFEMNEHSGSRNDAW